MKVIKWENKYSHETGFVGSVDVNEKHFVNTEDVKSAYTYKSAAAAEKAINELIEMGEGENNDFVVVDAPAVEKPAKTETIAKTEPAVKEEKPVKNKATKPARTTRRARK